MRNEVRRYRVALDMTQAELARVMGVSRQTINSIETERYIPSLPLALALARRFGVATEELYHEDESAS